MILLQTLEAKLFWTASLRDSQLLTYPTFENAIENPSHISRIFSCSELHTVAGGYQKGAGVTIDSSEFLWHLRKSKELLDQNIELLEWDYSVSFPDVRREQQKSNGGMKGDRRVGIECSPHGHAIISFLEASQGRELLLLPNPNDLQLADSIVVK